MPGDHHHDLIASSGNVFADLGFADSDEMMLKAELARKIASIIKHRHLTQAQAAQVLDIDQPKVSALLRGRLSGFSIGRLLRFLAALGRDVQIVVGDRPRADHQRGKMMLASGAAPAKRAKTRTAGRSGK